jgi:hypothetical protein
MRLYLARTVALLAVQPLAVAPASTPAARRPPVCQFSVSFPASLRSAPLTGRMLVAISRDSVREPRYILSGNGYISGPAPFFGMDVAALRAGTVVVLGDTAPGYPIASLRDLPPGDYYVQALANVYTQVHRGDGRVLWVHLDQWDGQNFGISPGNLVSAVRRVHLDPARGFDVKLELTRVLPPIEPPPDTKWVKHVRIQSTLLTKFWGQPIYLGATVLLPQGYDEHPGVYYPVLYSQSHFLLGNPLGFSTDSTPVTLERRALLSAFNRESGYELYKEWSGADFPRMFAVYFLHPTPYYDDSYAVNSANNGPYGDAIMHELIPYLEARFRMIPKAYARVLDGASTGGWEALALQLYHPDFFGGAWPSCPDPVDFHHYYLVNLYSDTNAYVVTNDRQWQSVVNEWMTVEQPRSRGPNGLPYLTMRKANQIELALGSRGRAAGAFDARGAVYWPMDEDGYPKPVWDRRTGHIDRSVVEYMRDQGYDLTAFLAKNWQTLAPKIDGKIHIDVGDMDNYYLEQAVYDLQALVDSSTSPRITMTFHYGRPNKGHGWRHTSTAGILREMAAQITANAPAGENTMAWKY